MVLVHKWFIFQRSSIKVYPHFRTWRISLAKNTQSFLYKKAISKQFKSLPIHAAALEGLIQMLKDSPHSLSHNSMKYAYCTSKQTPRHCWVASFLSKKLLVKRCLDCPDSVNNGLIVLIFSIIRVFKCFLKPSSLELLKNLLL